MTENNDLDVNVELELEPEQNEQVVEEITETKDDNDANIDPERRKYWEEKMTNGITYTEAQVLDIFISLKNDLKKLADGTSNQFIVAGRGMLNGATSGLASELADIRDIMIKIASQNNNTWEKEIFFKLDKIQHQLMNMNYSFFSRLEETEEIDEDADLKLMVEDKVTELSRLARAFERYMDNLKDNNGNLNTIKRNYENTLQLYKETIIESMKWNQIMLGNLKNRVKEDDKENKTMLKIFEERIKLIKQLFNEDEIKLIELDE